LYPKLRWFPKEFFKIFLLTTAATPVIFRRLMDLYPQLTGNHFPCFFWGAVQHSTTLEGGGSDALYND
jgi:hypothetical protein